MPSSNVATLVRNANFFTKQMMTAGLTIQKSTLYNMSVPYTNISTAAVTDKVQL